MKKLLLINVIVGSLTISFFFPSGTWAQGRGQCGDGYLDSMKGEQCDSGELNSNDVNTPTFCSKECKFNNFNDVRLHVKCKIKSPTAIGLICKAHFGQYYQDCAIKIGEKECITKYPLLPQNNNEKHYKENLKGTLDNYFLGSTGYDGSFYLLNFIPHNANQDLTITPPEEIPPDPYKQESATSFSDVTASNPHKDAISYVRNKAIVSGYPDGTYKPSKTINRAEFTKIIIKSAYAEDVIKACLIFDSTPFSDVQGNEWFSPYVCIAKRYGIVSGYPDGSFKPENDINIAEAAKILTKAFDVYTSSEDSGIWYKPFLRGLEALNAIPVEIPNNPAQELTRGQMAEFTYRLHGKIKNKSSKTYAQIAGERVVAKAKDIVQWSEFTNIKHNFSFKYPLGSTLMSNALGVDMGANLSTSDLVALNPSSTDHIFGVEFIDPDVFKMSLPDIARTIQLPLKDYAKKVYDLNKNDPTISTKDLAEIKINGKRAYLIITGGGFRANSTFAIRHEGELKHVIAENNGKKYFITINGDDPVSEQILTSFRFLSSSSQSKSLPKTQTRKVTSPPSTEYDYAIEYNYKTGSKSPYGDLDAAFVRFNKETLKKDILISSIKKHLPNLQDQDNHTLEILAHPKSHTDTVILEEIYDGIGLGKGKLYSYNPSTRSLDAMRVNSEYLNVFDRSYILSPGERYLAFFYNGLSNDGDAKELRVIDFVEDTIKTLVTLDKGQTLNRGGSARATSHEMKWLSNYTIQFGIYDQSKKGVATLAPLVKYREISVK